MSVISGGLGLQSHPDFKLLLKKLTSKFRQTIRKA